MNRKRLEEVIEKKPSPNPKQETQNPFPARPQAAQPAPTFPAGPFSSFSPAGPSSSFPFPYGPHSHLTVPAQPRTPRSAARVAPPSLTAPPGPSVGAARPPPRRTHSLTPRPHMVDSSLPSVCSPRSCPLLAAPSCLLRDPLPCGPPQPCRPTDWSASCPPRPSRTYAPAGFRGDRCSIHSPRAAPNPAAISGLPNLGADPYKPPSGPPLRHQ